MDVNKEIKKILKCIRNLSCRISSLEGGGVTASIDTQSKYLLSEPQENTFYIDGAKLRDVHDTPETLMWSKFSNQLTAGTKITKVGAMTTATITANDGVNDRVVVGAGTQTTYFYPTKQFASRRFVARIKVRVDALGTTPILGITSVWPGLTYNSFNNTLYYGYFNILTGAFTGATSHSDIRTTYNGWTAAVVGDIIEVELVTNYMEERVMRIMKNNSLAGEYSIARDARNGITDTSLQNHHYIGFIMADGTYTVLDNTISTKEPQYPKIMITGDSMSTSVRVAKADTIWGSLQRKLPHSVSLVGGTSLMQKGALAILHEIVTLKPEWIVPFLWIDPIYQSKSDPVNANYATWSADFIKWVNVVKSHGIKVIFPYPENWALLDPDGGDSVHYKDFLDDNFPTDLQLYIPASQATYDSTGFHYAAATNNWIADQLITILDGQGAL